MQDFWLGTMLGLFLKALMGVAVGKLVTWCLANLEELPIVTHYLSRHGGKSFDCATCRLGDTSSIDGISSH